MVAPRSRASASSSVVALCAAIVVAMALVFYLAAASHLFGGAERQFALAVAAVVAVPYALILLAALTGRIATACLMTFSAATTYLLLAAVPAFLLFLLSWEKGAIETLPFAAWVVQLIALVAAVIAWKGLIPEERAVPYAPWIVLLPIAAAGGLAALAFQTYTAATQAPTVRAANDSAMESDFRKFAPCLAANAVAHGGDVPEDAFDLEGPCGEVAGRVRRQTNYKVLYTRAPPVQGRHSRFTICLQPKQVPDTGLTTFVSDDSGFIAQASASEHSRDPVPCSQAPRGSPVALVKRFEYCLVQYWSEQGRREYPATLDPIRKALPGCIDGSRDALSSGRSRVIEMPIPGESSRWLTYTPTPADAGERGYWLYLRCGGSPAFAVIDAGSVILNADLPEARLLLNKCEEADDVDVSLLAQTAGLRLPKGFVPRERTARATVETLPPAPEFFGAPDLPARRAECQANESACFGFGRELERAIARNNGIPERDETMTDETREWLREARAAHVRSCKAGDARACASEASLAGGALDRDATHVRDFYLQGCTGGDDMACAGLAKLYSRGMSSTLPGIRTVRLMGQPELKIPTGIADSRRPAIAKDLARAAEYYDRACQLGDRDSCRDSAVALLDSATTPEDPARARAADIFARQCRRADYGSCLYLVRIAKASGGKAAGESTPYWQTQSCLFGGDSYCESQSTE